MMTVLAADLRCDPEDHAASRKSPSRYCSRLSESESARPEQSPATLFCVDTPRGRQQSPPLLRAPKATSRLKAPLIEPNATDRAGRASRRQVDRGGHDACWYRRHPRAVPVRPSDCRCWETRGWWCCQGRVDPAREAPLHAESARGGFCSFARCAPRSPPFGCAWSSVAIRSVAICSRSARSVMISVFVRIDLHRAASR